MFADISESAYVKQVSKFDIDFCRLALFLDPRYKHAADIGGRFPKLLQKVCILLTSAAQPVEVHSCMPEQKPRSRNKNRVHFPDLWNPHFYSCGELQLDMTTEPGWIISIREN